MNINLHSIRANIKDYPIEVELLSASICKETRATKETFLLTIPRVILAELNTHRALSRNVASSRAIPTKRLLQLLDEKPYYPMFWGANKAGMQSAQTLGKWNSFWCKFWWDFHRKVTIFVTKRLDNNGLHKQYCNRLQEPHSYIKVLLSGTDWDNFFSLRIDNDAMPEIVNAAQQIKWLRNHAEYRQVSNTNPEDANNWHFVYITDEERLEHRKSPLFLARLDSARCARTSYLTHEMKEPNQESDLKTFDMLTGRKLHASPLEHMGFPCEGIHGNDRGFKQFRQVWENMK